MTDDKNHGGVNTFFVDHFPWHLHSLRRPSHTRSLVLKVRYPRGVVGKTENDNVQRTWHAAQRRTVMEEHNTALEAMQAEQQRLRTALVDAELELQRVKVSADSSRPDPQV